MAASDVTVVYQDDAFAGTWPVFKVCLVLFPVGLLMLWYAKRLIEASSVYPLPKTVNVAYWAVGVVGAIAAGGGGFFGLLAFIVLLCNGLSLWWLLIPGSALGYLAWRAEQWIAFQRQRAQDRDDCCGLPRDEDGFCSYRPGHSIYVDPETGA